MGFQSGVPFSLNIAPSEKTYKLDDKSKSTGDAEFAVYDLKKMFADTRYINIGASYESNHIYGIVPSPVLFVDRKISGKSFCSLKIILFNTCCSFWIYFLNICIHIY